MSSTHFIRVGKRQVRITNPEKVFYPKTGFTKGEVIDYYIRIAPVLLKHLEHRALTLKRYPDGVAEEFFYEKQCPSHAPKWVTTTPVKKSDGSTICYCVIKDLPSLVWAANLANLELHPFLHRTKAPRRPAGVMFDLDPGPPAGIVQCCEVALRLRDLFRGIGLECLPKTSGSKGLQLFIPLNTAVTYRRTKPFAREVATTLADRFPDEVVSKMNKNLRKGKVLIDWSQNDDSKTTVAAYSLRAGESPGVSTPLEWREVEEVLEKNDATLLHFTPEAVLQRVEERGDLYAAAEEEQQELPQLQ